MTRRGTWVGFELGKIALLVGIILWVQDQVIGVRLDIAYDRNADARRSRAYAETVEEVVRDAKVELSRAREVLGDQIRGVEAETSQVRSRLEETERRTGAIDEIRRAMRRDGLRMKRAMVYPIVQLRGHGTVGSGIAISSRPRAGGGGHDTFILTAYHVVLDVVGNDPSRRFVEEIRAMGEDDRLRDEPIRGRLLAYDRPRDLAILRLERDTPFPYVARAVSRREAAALDLFLPAYAVGCPLGNMPIPTPGEISSKAKEVGGEIFWMLNAPTFFGNSGGGVFRAEDGALIGMSTMIYTYGKQNPAVVPHMGLFVPLGTIYAWLDEIGRGDLISDTLPSGRGGPIVMVPVPGGAGDANRPVE
ncbi:MAG: trypsin-like peptidase domain-containing protein [Planctomycetes bacterium]|nr:trypsin-like peptidase domain-containing protein [Planctomycetota bacterium]